MARILLDAICSGNVSLARDIIQDENYRGVDSQTSRRDGTALFFCCSRGYLDLALLLLAKNANVNARNKCRATPLHAAADNNHLRMVRLVLSRGADVNAQTHRGDTALHLAAFRGHADVAQYLVEHGGDFQLINEANVTAAMEARVQGHVELGQYLTAVNDLYGRARQPLHPTMDSSTSAMMIQANTPALMDGPDHETPANRRHQSGGYPGLSLPGANPLSFSNDTDKSVCLNTFKHQHHHMGDVSPAPTTPQTTQSSSHDCLPSSSPASPTSPMCLDDPSTPLLATAATNDNPCNTPSSTEHNLVAPLSQSSPLTLNSTSTPTTPSSASETFNRTSSESQPTGRGKSSQRLSMTLTPIPTPSHPSTNIHSFHQPRHCHTHHTRSTRTLDETQTPTPQHHHHNHNDVNHHRNCNPLPNKRLIQLPPPSSSPSPPLSSSSPPPPSVFHVDPTTPFPPWTPPSLQPRSRSPTSIQKDPEENEDESMSVLSPQPIYLSSKHSLHQNNMARHKPTPTRSHTPTQTPHTTTTATFPTQPPLFSLPSFQNNVELLKSPSNKLTPEPTHSVLSTGSESGASTSSLTSSLSGGDSRRLNDDFDLLTSIPLISLPPQQPHHHNHHHHYQLQQPQPDNSQRFVPLPNSPHPHSRSPTCPPSYPSLSPFFPKHPTTTNTLPAAPHSIVYHRLPSSPSSVASIDLGDPNQISNFDLSLSQSQTATQQQQQQQQQQNHSHQYNTNIQRSYSPMNVEAVPVESGACVNDSSTVGALRPMETSAVQRTSGTGAVVKGGDSVNDLIFTSAMSSNECDNETFHQTHGQVCNGPYSNAHSTRPQHGAFYKSGSSTATRVNPLPGLLNDLSSVKKTTAGNCVNYLNIPVGST